MVSTFWIFHYSWGSGPEKVLRNMLVICLFKEYLCRTIHRLENNLVFDGFLVLHFFFLSVDTNTLSWSSKGKRGIGFSQYLYMHLLYVDKLQRREMKGPCLLEICFLLKRYAELFKPTNHFIEGKNSKKPVGDTAIFWPIAFIFEL